MPTEKHEQQSPEELLASSDLDNIESHIIKRLAERAKNYHAREEGRRTRKSHVQSGREGDAHDRDSSQIALKSKKSGVAVADNETYFFDKDPHDKDPHDKDAPDFDRDNFDRDNFDRAN